MSEHYVKQVVKNRVCTIEFFHPAHNSLPGEMLRDLADLIQKAGQDEAVRVVILRSGGDRTFCAGASFNELAAIRDEAEGKKFFMGFAHVINVMRTCPKLIIGRVQGKAVGGGVGLAAAVDYCLATRYGAIKLSELGIGIGPFVVGPAIERKMGLSAFSRFTLDAGNFYDADWALDKGLYVSVFDDLKALDREVESMAEKLSQYNPEAMAELKKILWHDTGDWDRLLEQRAEISGRLVLSKYTQSKLAAYT